MKRNAKVLVLGATGHLGQAVVRAFAARGCRITAATRRAAPRELTGLDVRIARGDSDDAGQIEAWVAGHDVVVDAAAPRPLSLVPPRGTDPAVLARHRTLAVLEAVERHAAGLAFVSSFTTLPRPAGDPELEQRWRRAVYPYFRIKQLMEDLVLAAARRGLRVVVVNPSAFLGPWEYKADDASFTRLVLRQRLPATVRHVINVIDVRDVAAALYAALEARRYGVRIPLAGHNIGVDALAVRIAELAGVAPPPWTVAPGVAAVGALWAEVAWAMTGREAPDAVRAVPLIADAWAMEPGDEQRALGVPIRPLDATLRETVRWHLDHAPT